MESSMIDLSMAESKNIIKNLLPNSQKKIVPKSSESIPFGKLPTDHMFVCDYLDSNGGWQDMNIIPFSAFDINPDSLVLHYGQTIFEGLKAYRDHNDASRIYLFRPEANARRMANSAIRMGMQPFPEESFVQACKELVRIDSDWVLPSPGALYLRPSMISLDNGVSYRSSKNYRFFIIASPSKNYFNEMEKGVTLFIERFLARAAPGGTGEAKCGGNYAAALPSTIMANKKGADQVLWLDALTHQYVEEAGAMNIMFVYDRKIITPKLTGTILPGITRDSLIQLARKLGYEVKESLIKIEDILSDIKNAKLTEIFACGTAAVISPISALLDDNDTYLIAGGHIGEVTLHLKDQLIGIQNARYADTFKWCCEI